MGKFDFDKKIDRRGTNCGKWDTMDQKYGSRSMIHLGVADMDFASPDAIINEFKKINETGVFGYTDLSDGFYTGIQRWYRKQYGVDVERDWIVFCPRINIASSICVAEFTEPGEKVMMHTPAYGPLRAAILKNGREMIPSPLVRRGSRFEIDFKQMENAVTPDTKMLILCSPHNPTTRVFSKEELDKIADFALKHDLILFVDEIHADIVRKGIESRSMLQTEGEIQKHLIVASSLTKTFNVPGVIVSFMVIRDEAIRNRVREVIDRIGMHNPTIFAVGAVEKGYTECDEWYEAMLEYVDANEDFTRKYFAEHFPEFEILEREGTYLLWFDYSATGKNSREVEKWFLEQADVSVYMGSVFGESGEGYIRLNIASPRSLLEEAYERMRRVYPKLVR